MNNAIFFLRNKLNININALSKNIKDMCMGLKNWDKGRFT